MSVVRVVEEGGEDWVRLELSSSIPNSLANALRRAVINEVPTMAVEEVLIIENSSAMPNEILAHRISLIPFKSDIDNYNLPEECGCGSKLGCEKCVVRYVLRVEAGDDTITVYSRDMVPEDPNTKVAPVSGDFPIVMLAPNQRVELELYIRVGKGRKHAKWQSGVATLYEEDGRKYLYVESFGFLPARRMVKEALKIVKNKIENMERKFEEVFKGAEETH